MENRNRNADQQDNKQVITDLKRLREIASQQGRDEFVTALDKAIEALSGEDKNQDDKADGLRLSGTPAEQLLQLAADVKKNTTTPAQRTAAAKYLTSLAGGR